MAPKVSLFTFSLATVPSSRNKIFFFRISAKSYFEVLRKIFSHTEVEELPIPCPLVDHDKSLYPTI
ncbi:MAG: hypothetical protein LBL13_01485, partial [Bacteroidales bacterium]|nr:hypothetical protein [Bacteroidales bacterium]